MPDVFLYQGEPNPADVVLSDPTTTRASSSAGEGALTAPAATMDGAGVVERPAAGDLAAPIATAAGAATTGRTATGAITGAAATVDGAAVVVRAASGAIVAPVPIIAGSAVRIPVVLAQGGGGHARRRRPRARPARVAVRTLAFDDDPY